MTQQPNEPRSAVVCLSGGLDSAVVLAGLVAAGTRCEAVGFDYGQPHALELEMARRIAERYGAPLQIVRLPPMPLVNDVVFAGRNLVLVAHALSMAAAAGAAAVAFGCNRTDWDRFPDCRPTFWRAVNEAAHAYGVSVLLPLLQMTKSEVVQLARELDVPIAETWSCYAPTPTKEPCGTCLACTVRAEAAA